MKHLLNPTFTKSLMTGCLAITLNLLAWASADVTISPAELETKIKDYLQETTPLDSPEMKLHTELMWNLNQSITLSGQTLKVFISDTRRIPLTSHTIVQVNLTTETENRHLGVPVRLSVEKPVWVARRLIRAKEPITMNDVAIQRKLLSEDSFYAVETTDNVTQYTTRTNIPPGAFLDVRQVNIIPSVYRNDDVDMVMVTPGGVRIKIIGKAMEDGIIGKRIHLNQRLPNGKLKTFVGEVTGKNQVTVRM